MADPSKLYRFLLKLYPARFREEYEKPLEIQFRDDYREAPGKGRFWLRTLYDFARTAPVEIARELMHDLRYSVRTYARRPMITALAITALALAIGGTTGVFSVMNAVLLRSLPFREPERIVQLRGFPIGSQGGPTVFHAWLRQSAFLENASLYMASEMNLTAAEHSRIMVAETSANFFSMLGSEPSFGRAFTEDEEVPGKDGIAIISHALWQQAFGGDPHALGSTIRLNGIPLVIVGVARPGFDYPARTSLWTPTVFDSAKIPKTGMRSWVRLGRLKPGLSVAQAAPMYQAEIRHEAEIRNLDPGQWLNRPEATRPRLIPLREQLAGPVIKASLVLMGAVGFVLLIACANVANLLLTRVAERRKELVVRAALGASRARLVQQLMTESVFLTSVAAAAGIMVARWAATLASSVEPSTLTAQQYTVLDGRVLGFAVGIAVLTGIAFGVIPAWLIGRFQPSQDLIRSHQPGTHGPGAGHFRRALIGLQVALTLVLLAGSFTMGGSFLRLLGTDLGFRTKQVITLTVSLAGTRYVTDRQMASYNSQALDRLRAVPGVQSAAATGFLPLEPSAYMDGKFTLDSGASVRGAAMLPVTPDYFRTMGTEIESGREFTATDTHDSEPVAIVNDAFVRAASEGAPLLGRKVTSNWSAKPLTIVGISRTVRYGGPSDNGAPQIYLRYEQSGNSMDFVGRSMTFVARVNGRPENYLAICRDAIQSVDKDVPVFGAKTLDQRLTDNLARPRFYTTAVLFFGGFALLLAVIGIYGVASYSITQRRHEIGVRIAVGASPASVRKLLARQGLMPVLAGVAVGATAAIALGRVIEHFMETAKTANPWAFGSAALLLALIALTAIWIATRSVTRVDPVRILRAE
ncbi:MAG TPA: ABC transporter permease [Bryobacteraceae bacterium]|nr:ABC transporter permease [Bryobacteraceae bacterium]